MDSAVAVQTKGLVLALYMFDEALDVTSLDAGEGTSANGLLNDAEPAFDLVEPGRIGWGEIVVAGTPSEPPLGCL